MNSKRWSRQESLTSTVRLSFEPGQNRSKQGGKTHAESNQQEVKPAVRVSDKRGNPVTHAGMLKVFSSRTVITVVAHMKDQIKINKGISKAVNSKS